MKKFGDKLSEKIIDYAISKFDGENLAEIIEELSELSTSDFNEISENFSEDKQFSFIDFFRMIYLSNYYKALNYLDEFNIISDRKESIQFTQKLLRFCYLVLKTKISEENRDQNLIKLANVIDDSNFKKVIEFLTLAQNYLENYINSTLIFIRLILLIKNSFQKK